MKVLQTKSEIHRYNIIQKHVYYIILSNKCMYSLKIREKMIRFSIYFTLKVFYAIKIEKLHLNSSKAVQTSETP